jgi:16S rRNA (guanine527-N7)-methyltransferase
VKLSSARITKGGTNSLPNGIIYLKGGDILDEIKGFGDRVRVFDITNFFEEEFFETKRIIYLEI